MNNTHSPSLGYPCKARPRPKRTHRPTRVRLAQSVVRDSLLDTFFPLNQNQLDGCDGPSSTSTSGFCSLDESSEAPSTTSPSPFLLGEEHCVEKERQEVVLAGPFDGDGGVGGDDGDGNSDGDGYAQLSDDDAVGRKNERESSAERTTSVEGDAEIERGSITNEEREENKLVQDVRKQVPEDDEVMTSRSTNVQSLASFSSGHLPLSVPTVSATAEVECQGDDKTKYHLLLDFSGGTLESDSSADNENPPDTAGDTVFTLKSFAAEDVQSPCRNVQGDEASTLEQHPGNEASTLEQHPGNEASTLEQHPGNEASTLEQHPGNEASTLEQHPGNETSTLTRSVIARTKTLKKLLMQQILARVKTFNDTSEALRKGPNDDTITNINSLNDETVVHEVTQNEDNEINEQTQKEDGSLNLRIPLLRNCDQYSTQPYERILKKSSLETLSASHPPSEDPTGNGHPEIDGASQSTNSGTRLRSTTNSAAGAVTSAETVTSGNDSHDIDMNDKDATALRNSKLVDNIEYRVKFRQHNERRTKAGRLAPPAKPPRSKHSSKTVSSVTSLTTATRRTLLDTRQFTPQEALARIFQDSQELKKSDETVTRQTEEENRHPFQNEDYRLDFNKNSADGITLGDSSGMSTSLRCSPVVSHVAHTYDEDDICNTTTETADGLRVLHKPPLLSATDNNTLHSHRNRIKFSRAGFVRKRVKEPASGSTTQTTPRPQPQGSGEGGSCTPNKPARTSLHCLTSGSLEKDQEPCPDHGAALNFYCVKCRVVVCRDCTVVAHQQQEAHRVLDTPDSLATLRTEAVTLLRHYTLLKSLHDTLTQVYSKYISYSTQTTVNEAIFSSLRLKDCSSLAEVVQEVEEVVASGRNLRRIRQQLQEWEKHQHDWDDLVFLSLRCSLLANLATATDKVYLRMGDWVMPTPWVHLIHLLQPYLSESPLRSRDVLQVSPSARKRSPSPGKGRPCGGATEEPFPHNARHAVLSTLVPYIIFNPDIRYFIQVSDHEHLDMTMIMVPAEDHIREYLKRRRRVATMSPATLRQKGFAPCEDTFTLVEKQLMMGGKYRTRLVASYSTVGASGTPSAQLAVKVSFPGVQVVDGGYGLPPATGGVKRGDVIVNYDSSGRPNLCVAVRDVGDIPALRLGRVILGLDGLTCMVEAEDTRKTENTSLRAKFMATVRREEEAVYQVTIGMDL
ncbi:uncharacterized protein [Procambarus clarkii]|uniref:uncharacterized protein isoform X4 n=1 Tax=Procambarus clarkii TaxID=6728 RepID=UPI0037442CCD